MFNLSKYKITKQVRWADNLGRWVAEYESGVYPLKTGYLVPDSEIFDNGPEGYSPGTVAREIMDLNFWFLCFQYEQQLNNANKGASSNAQSASESVPL